MLWRFLSRRRRPGRGKRRNREAVRGLSYIKTFEVVAIIPQAQTSALTRPLAERSMFASAIWEPSSLFSSSSPFPFFLPLQFSC